MPLLKRAAANGLARIPTHQAAAFVGLAECHGLANNEELRAKAVSDAALAGSGLVWTIVRPGGLLDDEATGQVAVGRQLGSGRVSRADVAAVCVACLAEPATERVAFDLTAGEQSVSDALAGLAG